MARKHSKRCAEKTSDLAVQAVYKGTGKGGWNAGKGPSWSVQKYFNSGKGEKGANRAGKGQWSKTPEARKEEQGKREVARLTPEFPGAVGNLDTSRRIASRGVGTGV